jgi:hypothetical protein
MKFNDNPDFYSEIGRRVCLALCDLGIVNVAAIAENLRRVHPTENVYDIESAVLGYATLIGAPILFERLLSGERPASEHNRGLVIEIVEGHPDGLPN